MDGCISFNCGLLSHNNVLGQINNPHGQKCDGASTLCSAPLVVWCVATMTCLKTGQSRFKRKKNTYSHRSHPEVCLALICSNIKCLVLLCLIFTTPLVKQGTWNGWRNKVLSNLLQWSNSRPLCSNLFYYGTHCSGLQRPLFLLCYASATCSHVV